MSTTENKTHWKKLTNPDYLGSYSLQPNQELTLTIAKITREKVIGSGGKKQECTVAHFVENVKPMILNKLNSKVISKIHGTPFIEDWPNKKITIYSELVDAFGEKVDALRIKPMLPSLPTLTKEMPAYQKAVQHLKGGGMISDIEARFILTEQIRKDLENDAK